MSGGDSFSPAPILPEGSCRAACRGSAVAAVATRERLVRLRWRSGDLIPHSRRVSQPTVPRSVRSSQGGPTVRQIQAAPYARRRHRGRHSKSVRCRAMSCSYCSRAERTAGWVLTSAGGTSHQPSYPGVRLSGETGTWMMVIRSALWRPRGRNGCLPRSGRARRSRRALRRAWRSRPARTGRSGDCGRDRGTAARCRSSGRRRSLRGP